MGGPFSLNPVAGRIPFLVGGGGSLVVGWIVGWSAWWLVLPPQALGLFTHGGLWSGGVGWWAVVVVVVGVVLGMVVVVLVVVVVVVAGALVAVALVVVVMVLWTCP